VRLATIVEDGRPLVVAVAAQSDRVFELRPQMSMRELIATADLDAIEAQVTRLTPDNGRRIQDVTWAAAVPDPGAVFTVGANYRWPDEAGGGRPARPRILGKLPSSVAGNGGVVRWDRTLTPNVDAECELGVVVGRDASIFGYTIVNDMNSIDPWLDGDQWLLGKSMAGFCPLGPWIVTADELDPANIRLGCTINGRPIQDGRTSQMRFSIAEVLSYIGRHVDLRAGDVIATGTPARLTSPPGPDRHLRPRDVVTCWIEGIGELTSTIG
jgi:2-keto-4-pentenoate hydratase/2-oxohepta-3-ene-1,7-dioic acid hydratase in catechol pathway